MLLVTDEPQGVLQGGGGRGGGGGGGADQAAGNDARAAAIDAFVRAGGTLVCFNRSTAFAVNRLKLPVKDVTAGLGRQSFFAGTSLLHVAVDPSQRVMAGMPERAAIFFSGSPAFETLDGFTGTVLARYPDTDALR